MSTGIQNGNECFSDKCQNGPGRKFFVQTLPLPLDILLQQLFGSAFGNSETGFHFHPPTHISLVRDSFRKFRVGVPQPPLQKSYIRKDSPCLSSSVHVLELSWNHSSSAHSNPLAFSQHLILLSLVC